jgi:energy-coupling factor transporter ATP-binding protein EcfA2
MSDEQFKRIAALNEVFTPAAPIEIKALFSGRVDQLDRCVQLVFQKGTHGIIYGDRGVGKTSIANILKIVFDASPVTPIKDSCHTEDTFDSLWTKLFKQVELPFETVEKQIGFTSE